MQFKNVVGHDQVKTTLIRSIQEGRISHAQLFLGQEGSGNLAMALAYLQYLYCENREDNDACNSCASCKKVAHLAHPDIHFSFPFIRSSKENESADTYMHVFRDAVLEDPYLNLISFYEHLGQQDKQGIINVKESKHIIDKLSLKSFEGGYKAYLIWMPEKMNMQAANKLLKTIEEPPEKTVIILVSNDSEQIISTILSRTQLVKLGRLSDEEISAALVNNYEMVSDLADNIAAMSEGDYFHAKQLALHSDDENVRFEHFRDWMRLCFKKDVSGVSQWVDTTAKLGRVKQKDFLKYAIHMLRQCALFNYNVGDLVKISGEERVFMQKFAPFIDHVNLQDYIDLFSTARKHIDRNANAKILFTDLSYQVLVHLKKANDRKAKSKA